MADDGNERNRRSPARKVEVEAPDTSHEREDERVTEQDKFGNAALLAQMDLEQAAGDGAPRGAADVALDHFFDNGGIVDIDDDAPLDADDLPFSTAAARRRREEEDASLEALLAPGLPPEDKDWLQAIRAASPLLQVPHVLAPPAEVLSGLTDRWLNTAAPFAATTPLRAAQLATVHPPPVRLQGRDDNPLLGVSVALGLAGALLRDLPKDHQETVGVGLDIALWACLSASPWREGDTILSAVARHVTLPPPAPPSSQDHRWFRRLIESAMAVSTAAAPQLVLPAAPKPPRDADDPLDVDAILNAALPNSVPPDHLHLMARETAEDLDDNAEQLRERLSLAAWACCVATRSVHTAAAVAHTIRSADQLLDQAQAMLSEIHQGTHGDTFTPLQLERGLVRAHKLLRKARRGATRGLSAALVDGLSSPVQPQPMDVSNPVVAAFADGQVLHAVPVLRADGESEAADWIEAVVLGIGSLPDVTHGALIRAVLQFHQGNWDAARASAAEAMVDARATENGELMAAAVLLHLEAGGEVTLRDEVGHALAAHGAWVALSLLSRWTAPPEH